MVTTLVRKQLLIELCLRQLFEMHKTMSLDVSSLIKHMFQTP